MNIRLDAGNSADKEYIKLREALEKNLEPNEVEEIDNAYAWARDAHEGQLRFSGQPYIIHPIAVSKILADYGMDKDSVIAAMLHDIVEDTDATTEDVKERFGEEVASLVDGLTKLGKVSLKQRKNSRQKMCARCFLPCRRISA